MLFFLLLPFSLLGLCCCAELLYRRLRGQPNKNLLLALELFPFREYLGSTQPRGLALGKQPSILDRYYRHGPCDGPDGVTCSWNDLGFRGPSCLGLGPKKTGECRILLTGGSVAASWYTNDACMLDRLLEDRLADRSLPVRVFNLASGAWISLQELIALRLFLHHVQPDLVIALDGFNDIQHTYYLNVNESYTRWMLEDGHAACASRIRRRPGDLWRHAALVEDLRGRLHKAPTPSRTSPPETADAPLPGCLATRLHLPLDLDAIAARRDFDPHNQNSVAAYVRNQQTMHAMTRQAGAAYLCALQPALVLKTPLADSERQILETLLHDESNYVAQGLLRLRAAMTALHDPDQGLHFLDCSQLYAGCETAFFKDNCHVFTEGYHLVADALAEAAAPILSRREQAAARPSAGDSHA